MPSTSGTDLMDSLVEKYAGNTTLRVLAQLVPAGIGAAADTGIIARAERIKAERTRALFDELASGKTEITEDLIETDEFLHCYFATVEAAQRTRRHEKIALFGRLLKSSFGNTAPRDIDEFEELLSILDDLSFTEWQALLILDRYSNAPRGSAENDLQWSNHFWRQFLEALTKELNIPKAEATSFLNRIQRTGLYEQFVGGFMDYTGGVGKLTPRFHRLKQFIASQ